MKTLYYRNTCTDPAYNLALEQHLFESVPAGTRVIMLWQNDNSIIIGKFQNTVAELNHDYVKEHNIHVVRRSSGGGAVYHDLGNINYTIIDDIKPGELPDFRVFCEPIVEALARFGVHAEVSGRNDICVDGKKISGTAQHSAKGRVSHHGTLLFDSNMEVLSHALHVSEDKYSSRANTSVRSRVTNIRPLLNRDMSAQEFIPALEEELLKGISYETFSPTPADEARIREIQKERYDSWDWNYGISPAYNVVRKRRFEGCGTLDLQMDVENGLIQSVRIYGDYFCYSDITELEKKLSGVRLEENALLSALREIHLSDYLQNIPEETFAGFLLGSEN